MKRILITGANSYIGTSFKEYLKTWDTEYVVDTLSLRDKTWKSKNFSEYDVVFHVAGIAHVSTKSNMEQLYYEVNRDLAVETGKKAKMDGVGQFIFMSSIIVYGESGCVGQKKIIDKNTKPMPSNFYGRSKLQAEQGLMKLQEYGFKVVIVRAPMVFGKGSKGNYPKLVKIAKHCPIFPDIENERSMIYIDNLCEFIRLMVENEEVGIFHPQNIEYVKTSELVELIAKAHNKNIKLTRAFNHALKLLSTFILLINKVFGNLIYEKDMSNYKENYMTNTLQEGVLKTEVLDKTRRVGVKT